MEKSQGEDVLGYSWGGLGWVSKSRPNGKGVKGLLELRRTNEHNVNKTSPSKHGIRMFKKRIRSQR